ncbi:type VI secretion system baseplate subunit TssE [Albidovulum sp.]|uniref:type VI secretion system baseplate subunit TssE n=1 Tax=Albidovulum sp. TaxID=1872424 RepID=UPI001D89E9DD|nr:type VI secretion system baseplate subunit TssE [Paracoccaceae bacterium]MCC0046484.1 type VI secretion system baseplate subunit TssE [Defluviimonas sp.]HPE26183.1 type VI secretion system baseplate subunit TssE [Albidovulum sp.]MCB2132249.1 type VI secretion system baseplate subunit TssE [Paracoccaceae bacterium]MCB2143861.1 type VI secretion system baseplate subunit TssE [Paracoccaceae bacterium]
MADLTITERLQPSLLDRLTDTDPSNPNETRDSRVIDIRRLRDIIQRDLSWLLNSQNAETLIDAVRYPNASESVLNFGLKEVTGEYSSVERAQLIRASISRAISLFEPRIAPGSLDVELLPGDSARQSIVTFEIRADMWAQPVPMELYLRSEVDVTTGELKLERRG